MGAEYQQFGTPHMAELGPTHIADGVIIATVLLPDDPSLGPAAGKPAILFEFATGTKLHAPTILLPGPDIAGLVDLVKKAVDALPVADSWRQPPPETVNCPGCHAPLHGDARKRGGCFGCFPVIPGDEARQ